MATSAIWKITCRAWRTTFVPIWISFSRNVVNVRGRIARGLLRTLACETVHGDGAPWLQEACGNDSRQSCRPYDPNGGRTARPELGIR